MLDYLQLYLCIHTFLHTYIHTSRYGCVDSSGGVGVLLPAAGCDGLPAGRLPRDAHLQTRNHVRLHRRRAEETGQTQDMYVCM